MRKITVILICFLIFIFCMGFVSANNMTSSLECSNIDDFDVDMLSIDECDSLDCSKYEVNIESDFEERSQQGLNYPVDDILESNVCDSFNCSIEDEVIDLDKSNGANGIFQQENNDSDEGYVVYVGCNVTSDGGNGSFNNPYNNFKMACSNVNGEDKVTLKVFNGTYKIGSVLRFNTTNLNVYGIGGTVIIENEFNEGRQGFGLISSSANFTMSNIIFNASTYNSTISTLGFAPFIGSAQFGVYNNCTFYGFMRAIDGSQYDTVFNNCYFHSFGDRIFINYYVKGVSTTFNYCIFAIKKEIQALSGIIYNNNNITFNNVWFGQNMLPAYVFPPSTNVVDAKTNRWVSHYQHSVTKYAILEISEHFLGDNHYEVIGKLMWNDSTTDGIENFNPMYVQLSSSTGILPSTAVLENGFFRVNYTSNLTKHNIFAKLDFAEFDLEFESHDVILKPNHVYYGDDQNISISLPQGANGYVNVSVNNKTYIANVTDSLFNFTIPDTLKEGSYNVDVLYIDKFNHFYGNASTQISISKVSDYKMEVITSGDVMVGENAVIIIELPSDVSGLVNISFLNKTIQYNASKTLIVNISGFNAGNNPVYVRYGGDDKYNPQSRNDVIYVDRAESDVVLLNDKFYYGESNVIHLDIINATGIKAKLFKDDLEIGNISVEGGNVTLSVLDAGDYILEVISEVNSNYNSVCKYFNITILKAESRIYGPSIRYIYGDEIIVNLNSDEFVEIFDINNNLVKTSYSSLINSSDLGAGNYTLKIISPVDKNHVNASISDLIIFKANPFVGVVSKGGFVGESAKIDVNLAKNAKGNVSVNVNGQNYSSDVVNGHAVIFIPDLGVNKYDLEVVYSGDDNYNSTCNLTTFYINPVPFQVLYPKTCEIGEEINISVVFLKEIKCNFTVMIGNNCYFNRTVNESFIFSISDLTLGENKIDVSYSDETGSCYLNFTVFAKKVTLSESIFNFDSNDFKGVFVNLANDASGNLTVIVNNETLTKVLVNGGASVDVTGLSVGNYNLFVIYSGDDKYNSIIKNTTVTVKAIITSIVAPDISASYGVAKNLVITLKDVNGNKLVGKEVTVKVGTISKTLTSNNKGQISINIASLAPKTYKATIKFAGDSKYASTSKTVKVTVNKSHSKITAKKTTFNAKKKIKKYTITLKASKKAISKVKVTINIGKKTYTAKTNNKGKATFNLKKLTKKGKYTAVIMFAGNKYYKATTKKVKITVKK